MFDPTPLDDALTYTVPEGRTAQLIYFRAGNHSEDLIYFSVMVDGVPVRYFPVGPKADVHVTLAILESVAAGKRLEICIAAPRGLAGAVVVDAGLLEKGPA